MLLPTILVPLPFVPLLPPQPPLPPPPVPPPGGVDIAPLLLVLFDVTALDDVLTVFILALLMGKVRVTARGISGILGAATRGGIMGCVKPVIWSGEVMLAFV